MKKEPDPEPLEDKDILIKEAFKIKKNGQTKSIITYNKDNQIKIIVINQN